MKNSVKKDFNFILGIVLTAIVVVPAIIGIFWTPYGIDTMNNSLKMAGCSLAHPFGCDNFGRDIFSRVMKAIGTSFLISVFVVAMSGLAGVLIGAVTGYFGGIVDTVVMRVVDAVNGFPSILLALVMISLLGKGRWNIVIALGIAFTPSFVRIVRKDFKRIL